MGKNFMAGVDEAGRGPLAGPVAVGVVMVPEYFDIKLLAGVKDSKLLTAEARQRLYKHITSLTEVSWGVAMVSAKVIDRVGISEAVRRALARALTKAGVDPKQTRILLDGGLKAPSTYTQQKTIIRGDRTEPLISAASILAKVTRDRYMERIHEKYPKYDFATHKGYGTDRHRSRIRAYGLSPLHRKTFCH